MTGLSHAEAAARRRQYGPNALPAAKAEPLWRRFARQFRSPLIYVLILALVFDLAHWAWQGASGWPLDAVAILLILLCNAALGLRQEYRAEAALSKLSALAAAHAWVLREGVLVRLDASEVVPGDRLRIDAGDRVPADGHLVDPRGVMVDEAILTGESQPLDKGVGDEVFSGTLLVRGVTWIDVTRTGADSAMGRLAVMLESVRPVATPLERRVDQLGRQIARWTLVLAAALGAIGIAAEGIAHAADMIILAVALAVAAVPEGLPAVLSVALALGVERMARRRAVVRRLASVEALGSVTVILSDKTGTITGNLLEVQSIDAADLARACRAAVFASDADAATAAGDPMDLALVRYAGAQGLDAAALRREAPIVSTRPFDSAWRFTRVTVRDEGVEVSYLKGAPEVILGLADLEASDRTSWTEKAEAYAGEGFRVLALADGEGQREEHLRLLGLALLWDPPRPEVAAAIETARAAGIRVAMVTGDHPATALDVAHRVGITGERVVTGADLDDYDDAALAGALAGTNVFARIRPEQKLRLVEAFQAQGEIVAMTGDGVNDAAALKRADVGVAMGLRGSDVSREVADLVLLDDHFATIVAAVEEGRGIFGNIQKFLRFLLSTNLSEVVLVAGGVFIALGFGLRDDAGELLVPLTAAQILWINLITDGLPAIALAFDRSPGVMLAPPRAPSAPLLDRWSTWFVVTVGVSKAAIGLCVLGFIPLLGYAPDVARAVTFHFMAVGQLGLTYASRRGSDRPRTNLALHAAVLSGIAIQVGVSVVPVTAAMLGGVTIPPLLWALVFGAAAAAWAIALSLSRAAPAEGTGAARRR